MERRSYRSWKSTASALIGKIKVDVGDVATTRTSSERAPSLCFYWTHWNSERFRDSFRTMTSIWTSSATAASSTTLMRLMICFFWVFCVSFLSIFPGLLSFKSVTSASCQRRQWASRKCGRRKERNTGQEEAREKFSSWLIRPPFFFFFFEINENSMEYLGLKYSRRFEKHWNSHKTVIIQSKTGTGLHLENEWQSFKAKFRICKWGGGGGGGGGGRLLKRDSCDVKWASVSQLNVLQWQQMSNHFFLTFFSKKKKNKFDHFTLSHCRWIIGIDSRISRGNELSK